MATLKRKVQISQELKLRRSKQLPPQRGDKDTLWKLVEARRTQLADAIAAARVPFFLGLTWSFIWFAALYVNHFSYVEIMSKRYLDMEGALHDVKDLSLLNKNDFLLTPEEKISKNRTQKAWDLCRTNVIREKKSVDVAGKSYEISTDWQFEVCKRHISFNYENSRKAEKDFAFVQLPAGMGRIHISDFGILGNAGLVLILTWTYYATRRENHAIRSFVDFDEDQRKILPPFPREFNLRPQDLSLSAKHYCYSYYAVAQRFVFVFSTHSRPLMMSTIGLCLVPVIVSTLNLLSDIHSVSQRPQYFELVVHYQVSITFALTCVAGFLTFCNLRILIETSVLLNGWLLAVTDVWIEHWKRDENDPAPDPQATEVVVYVTRQFAVAIEDLTSQPR